MCYIYIKQNENRIREKDTRGLSNDNCAEKCYCSMVLTLMKNILVIIVTVATAYTCV